MYPYNCSFAYSEEYVVADKLNGAKQTCPPPVQPGIVVSLIQDVIVQLLSRKSRNCTCQAKGFETAMAL